ncbi:meiotic recombination protein REC8 homolog [Littorina saxatilis]|uniref:Uncharacterized protein n=1 Tax=Littorina saxatilis TaxID=31220 RepID=A0AAN9BQ47_9CAEN
MFYHQVLLKKRGQFGLIWMEAMQSSAYKLTKRQTLQVDIRRSCEEIVEHVYSRRRNQKGKIENFSLYLSAQLMYGTVSVYGKQVQYLLSEAQEMGFHFGITAAALETINLKGAARRDQVTMQSPIQSTEDANPFFGSFKDFFDEHGDDFYKGTFKTDMASPPSFDSPSKDEEPHDSPKRKKKRQRRKKTSLEEQEAFRPGQDSPHTVPAKHITMDEQPFSPSLRQPYPVPGEVDLLEPTGQDLELMEMKVEEEVVPQLDDLFPEERLPSSQEETSLPDHEDMPPPRGDKTPRKATKGKEERPKGEKKKTKRKRGDDDDEDLDRTRREEATPRRRRSPLRDTSFELQPVKAGPGRRRRRRQLFVDVEKEMSRDDLRHNMSTSETICRDPSPNREPHLKLVPVKDLFENPGRKELASTCNPAMRRLWKRNCKEGILETESDAETPIWTVPDAVRGPDGMRRVRRRTTSSEDQSPPQEPEPYLRDIPFSEMLPVVDEEPSIERLREASLLSRSRTPQSSPLHLAVGQSPLSETSLSRTRSGRKRSHQSPGTDDELSGKQNRSASLPEEPPTTADVSVGLDVVPEEMEEFPSPPISAQVPSPKPFSPEKTFLWKCEEMTKEGSVTTFRKACPPSTMTRPQAVKCFLTLLELCKDKKLFALQREAFGDIYISTSQDDLTRCTL